VEFTGTPLTIKLLSEIYRGKALSEFDENKFEGNSSLYELFNMFLEAKIRINNEDKIKLDPTNVQANRLIKTDRNLLIIACQKLALRKVLSPEELKKIPEKDYVELSEMEFELVLKYGLITGSLGNEKFIHKTFAEFFVLLYLISRLNQSSDIFIFFVRVLLTEKRFQVIRTMFESYLKNLQSDLDSPVKFSGLLSEEYGILISALHVACREGNSKTVKVLFSFMNNNFEYPHVPPKLYFTILNYFDEKTGQKTSSFEQLRLEAFRQAGKNLYFRRFVTKEHQNLNQILFDLKIIHKSSDGFRFVNNLDCLAFTEFIEVFGESNWLYKFSLYNLIFLNKFEIFFGNGNGFVRPCYVGKWMLGFISVILILLFIVCIINNETRMAING
jgi:hypothetical protein